MSKFAFRLAATASIFALGACTGVGGPPASASTAAGAQQGRNITATEKQQGAEYNPQILQEFGGAYQGKQAAYVETVGKNIAVRSGLGNARSDFNVTLLNSSVNNAFAIPGGYVYVTRQLMALMNDEAELAGVLGHEVGHVAARHSEKRQKKAQRNGILGVLGQVASAVLLGDTAAGRLGQQVFGTGSQLLTLSYSRTQEYEADDLGIRYLAAAGYDPKALSSMLASLAAQSAIDVRASGQPAQDVPTWASTHPDPAARVSRALKVAGPNAAGVRNRDTFLNELDGILYGDDPQQGIIEGTTFRHPGLRLTFTAPNGFGLQNGTSAVSVNGQSGKAQFLGLPYNGNLESYISTAFQKIAGDQAVNYGAIQRTTVNGIPAAYATARVNSDNQQIDVTVFAYEFSKNQAYHFVTLTAAGQGGVFSNMFQSMRRLSANEAASVKARKLDVVTVKSGDTVAGFARRMAYDNLQTERFLALNGLPGNAKLQVGQRVKIVTY